ncbi:E3 ubiquitin-protein ligase CHIP [Golovinomyces cichoracearum]|uniref:E3 ubiquitin-protein ligase CHIP n=1 Tax=Golovinomyces cichoracearum TaxID=62708 RepID=A0A420IDI1_9PEZI|nr:E3 ubiquitin-protein ligase CHIP [Golovinomyces cichoracearum]
MVNEEQARSVSRALKYKERGNSLFKSGDYKAAEISYTKAIYHDPKNHLLLTNRAMVLLRLCLYDRVIDDAKLAISLFPQNMKAYFLLAQAQLAKLSYADALFSAQKAREYCLDEMYAGKKGANSIEPITELVLKCKKKNWESKEREREISHTKLLREVQCGLEERRDKKKAHLKATGNGNEAEVQEVEKEYQELTEEFRRIWGLGTGEKKREVPDWCIDSITLMVMLDPVVTKTGQSYDRASILEHLKRSETDPLTREPLHPEDLRPNLTLRDACQDFLKENGWAVDW